MDEVAKQDEGTTGRRRRKAYQEFLDVTNKKEALFRDIIIESEYDVSSGSAMRYDAMRYDASWCDVM